MRTKLQTLTLDKLQREIAAEAEISEAHLSMIISGERKPSLDVGIRLASILDSSVEELWG